MMKSRWAGRTRLVVVATVGTLTCGLLLPAFAGAAAAATASGLGPPNTWVGTGQMGNARSGQTATLLPNGQVLIAGGGTARAELYNPATRTFSPTGRMPMAVTDATATLLGNGEVLVAGGLQRSHQLANAELYNPATGAWAATGSMTRARSGQTAILLPNGQVLVAGGGCNGTGYGCDAGSFLSNQRSAELYNPATGTWTRTGNMAFGRENFAATLLRTGKVLVTGGFNNCDDDFCSDIKNAELYDPATGKWSATGSMHNPREQHSATLLPNGEVLVAGGLNAGGFCCSQFSYSSAELYNPATGTWSPAASMAKTHAGHTATLLRNGWVLVAGGGNSLAEIYEPQRNIWVLPGAMSTVRTGQTATLLPNGHVLVTGGNGPDGHAQASAEEFLAGHGPLVTVSPTSIAFGGQRVGTTSGARSYTVTNVGTANLVVSGTALTGKNPGDFRVHTTCASTPVAPGGTCTVSVRFAPTTIELRTAMASVSDNAPLSPQGAALTGFGGGPNSWVPVGSMTTPREDFTATLLQNGKVLMAGGDTVIDNPLASAELYNPATHSFTATGSLNTPRSNLAAALLPNGQVLAVGGISTNFVSLSSAELYNPATGKWTNTTPANATGYNETATLLPDGDVLATGFSGANVGEVYNPAKATWTNTGPLTSTHGFASATLLGNGQVLLAGGGTAAAELYSPATNTWKATGSMVTTRQEGQAVLLRNGDVLVTGGAAPNGGNALANAELYNPATGKWAATGSMNAGRAAGTATLLPDGTVLATGGCTGSCGNQPGLSSTEIFGGQFWFLNTSMTQPRVFQTATPLPDGSVLVAGGGTTFYSAATSTAELFTPVVMSVRPASGPVGTQVTVSGSGFFAGEHVSVLWDGGVANLGGTLTSASGTFSIKVTIPQATAGTHQIAAEGRRSFAGATSNFTVTS